MSFFHEQAVPTPMSDFPCRATLTNNQKGVQQFQEASMVVPPYWIATVFSWMDYL